MPFQTRQRLTWAGCVLVGVCMLARPAASQPPDPLALQAQLEQVQKLQQATTDELKAQNKELQERLKAQETALLETQRKSIDWWFSLLGAMVGALAVMFGALPLLLTRQQKADIEKELTSAKDLVASIRGHEQQARDTSEKLNSYVSGQPQSAAQQDDINREIASIQRSSTATDTDKLRARAIQASDVDKPTPAQALAAFDLWKALTLLVPHDASAQFNAGYWAQQLYEQSAKPGRTHWFEVLVSFYGQALQIKPDMYAAANNWGGALNKEAQELAKQDLGAARALWQQAGEKCAQALKIKTDNHDAASNWGAVLCSEAHALLARQMDDEADQVLARTASLQEQHIAEWPDSRGALAYNLACVYSLQGKVADAVAQLEASRQADELPDHWPTDRDLNPIRTSAEYQAWVSQHFPNPIPTDTNASKGT